jgi:predicted kinase
MNRIYMISGPCGCGKSTLADELAKRLRCGILHGDDICGTLGEHSGLAWPQMLGFTWDGIFSLGELFLQRNLDVVIDYVVEDELPLLEKFAAEHAARLYYVVLVAKEDTLRRRITARGDTEMIDRSLFLRKKLSAEERNRPFLLNNTDLTVSQTADYLLECFENPHKRNFLLKESAGKTF